MTKPSQEELDAMLAFWQRVLRVQDWDVKALISRQEHLPNDVSGSINPVPTKKSALIKILDPIDYSSDCEWDHDIERILVHELIHLHFVPFMVDEDKDESKHVAQEQAIESLACGFVALKRRVHEQD